MKLSPEARQAIKTSIEQLRLLLVDDAMDTIREETRKHWVEDGKGEDEKITLSGDCRVEGKLSAGKIRCQTEKHPDEEVPEVERIVSAIIRNVASSELLRQLS